MLIKALPLIALTVLVATPAQSESLTVSGKTGYVSEWELAAKVEAVLVKGSREFSGPLTLKHVGLCSANGPEEKPGEIRFQISGFRSSRLKAVLTIDGQQCAFNGALSNAYTGEMDCLGARGLPVSLSIQ